MFELNQLRSFVTIANEMSFRRAAKTLNITQPPLTRQIQLLEREVGVQLFDRTGRAIRLTAAGQRFLTEAEDLLRRAEGAALSARRVDSGLEGTIILGFIPVAALGLLPQIIETVRQVSPRIDLVLQEMSTVDQAEALPAGRIDIGLMRPPRDHSRLQLTQIVREPFAVAINRNHPLAGQKRFNLQDLDGQDFIMYSPSGGAYVYEILTSLLSRHGVHPNIVQLIGQCITILSLVNANEGLALVPEFSHKTILPNVLLKPADLPENVATEYHLGIAKSTMTTPLIERVHQALLDRFIVNQTHADT